MRVGLVCPYAWDVPGGVQGHVRDLAAALIALGHEVGVLSPVDDEDADVPPYVTRAGGTVPIPYNGSISRLLFGPVSAARARRWVKDGEYDVLHLHSPETFSLSLLTTIVATGPMVATFHAYNPRSRILTLLQTPLQTQLEKIRARIAVSDAARKTIVEHLGGDAVVIPNGVDVARFATAKPLPAWSNGAARDGQTLGFVGRLDEPRKGFHVLVDAFGRLVAEQRDVRLLAVGPGDAEEMLATTPSVVRERITLLGRVDEATKAAALASVDAFVAPNTGGESFGIILLEAMAAGAPIVASDLEPFRRVLADGRAGHLVAVDDPVALAAGCAALLDDEHRRAELTAAGRHLVSAYDWPKVAASIVRVYEMVTDEPGGDRPQVLPPDVTAAAEAVRIPP